MFCISPQSNLLWRNKKGSTLAVLLFSLGILNWISPDGEIAMSLLGKLTTSYCYAKRWVLHSRGRRTKEKRCVNVGKNSKKVCNHSNTRR